MEETEALTGFIAWGVFLTLLAAAVATIVLAVMFSRWRKEDNCRRDYAAWHLELKRDASGQLFAVATWQDPVAAEGLVVNLDHKKTEAALPTQVRCGQSVAVPVPPEGKRKVTLQYQYGPAAKPGVLLTWVVGDDTSRVDRLGA